MAELFVFAGQSNQLGYGLTGADLPNGYGGTDPYTYIWTASGWQVMQPGVNTGTPANPGAWGPEVAFAHEWRQTHAADDALYIVKSVKGSTALAQNTATGALDWSPDSVGELFDLTADRIAAARASFGALDPGVEATFWMQGEQDATAKATADAYAANLTGFLAEVREEWMGDPEGYVGLGRISNSTAMAYNEEVRVAQWSVDQADAHMESFKTIGYEMQADGLHYAASGHVAIGQAFFDGWA